MGEQALGIIETMGLVPALEAADISLKTANVSLNGLEFVGAGRVTIKLRGDVSSVKASVDAGRSAAQLLGEVLSTTVIARPAQGVETITDLVEPRREEVVKKSSDVGGQDQPQIELKETAPDMEKLEKMSVVELRTMVRDLPDSPMAKAEIRSARKQDLIAAIYTYYQLER